ncbi:hypothetical protein RHECNPAF_69007 [Rhizobium etli CNPAF512]|nr:hypothetical protein RHECNPAF_69007 [Rhizobium etli CNPAF512]
MGAWSAARAAYSARQVEISSGTIREAVSAFSSSSDKGLQLHDSELTWVCRRAHRKLAEVRVADWH